MTQNGLASKLEVNHHSVAEWENAIYNPLSDNVEKLADFFECEVDDFYLDNYDFAIKHSVVHPVDHPKMVSMLVNKLYAALEGKGDVNELHKLILAFNQIAPHLQQVTEVYSEMGEAEKQIRARLNAAKNKADDDDDPRDKDLIDDPDYDPRKL